jgi:hypothetical protein
MKSSPKFNPDEDENKINSFNGDLGAYFEDLMRRRPQSTGGYINLPKENFRRMVERAANQKDLETLKYAHANYLGHRNVLPQVYVDQMLLKALELGQPETMLETLTLHSELIYHPSPKVVSAYFEFFRAGAYEGLKAFFRAVKGNYFLVKPEGFYPAVIELASANGDGKTVIQAYLDILDYERAGL